MGVFQICGQGNCLVCMSLIFSNRRDTRTRMSGGVRAWGFNPPGYPIRPNIPTIFQNYQSIHDINRHSEGSVRVKFEKFLMGRSKSVLYHAHYFICLFKMVQFVSFYPPSSDFHKKLWLVILVRKESIKRDPNIIAFSVNLVGANFDYLLS